MSPRLVDFTLLHVTERGYVTAVVTPVNCRLADTRCNSFIHSLGGMLGTEEGLIVLRMTPNRTVQQGSRVVVRLSSSDHPNSDLRALIHGHPFNHAVLVLLPLPDSAEAALDSAGFEALAAFNAVVTAVSASQCYAARVDLAALGDEDFIKASSAILALASYAGGWSGLSSTAASANAAQKEVKLVLTLECIVLRPQSCVALAAEHQNLCYFMVEEPYATWPCLCDQRASQLRLRLWKTASRWSWR